jgi:hypothetical protein
MLTIRFLNSLEIWFVVSLIFFNRRESIMPANPAARKERPVQTIRERPANAGFHNKTKPAKFPGLL